MDKQIKVSVIVPIYNVEDYLRRCVQSLVAQTLGDIEIILVNDGSPDNSQAIIEEFAAKYPDKVIGIQKENGGLSDARNYGIPYAHGEYIGFLDSDDYADITMYEKLYQKAKEDDADIAICGYYGIDENKGSYRYFQKGNMHLFGNSLRDEPKLLYSNAPYAWNKIYRRELFEKTNIRFPKGLLYEDIATIYPLFMYANKITKVDEALVYYILKREGAITATFNRKILQMYDALARMNDLYIEGGKFADFYEQLGFINIKHTILRFRDFTLYEDKKLQRDMVKQGFAHLHKYFPDWRKNKTFFDFYFKNKKLAGLLAKHRWVWHLYILIPNRCLLFGKRLGKLCKKIKRVFTKRFYINKFYYAKLCKKDNIKKKQVLFESFHGTTLDDSPFAMMKELAKDPSFKIYYTSKKERKREHQKLLDRYKIPAELVCLGTRKYQKVLAESEYLVNNVSFPTYFMKRPQQIYINTWHGTPLKTLGKKMVRGIQDMSNMQRNFLEATYLLYPNEYTMKHMMEDYNLNQLYTGNAILAGYPRNAIFMDKDKAAEIRARYHMEGKEVFVYMPTWRGAASTAAKKSSYGDTVKTLLQEMDQALRDDQVLYVNLHPLVQQQVPIEGYRHIIKFPEDANNYEFMNAADVLISDYSSVFFDFSITQKPIVLFMYDYEEYMEERGMYLDVRTLPFEKIYTIEDLKTYFAAADKRVDYSRPDYAAYKERFLKYDSPESIRKLNDLIFYQKNDGVRVIDYSHNKEIERTLFLAPKVKHKGDIEIFEKIRQEKNLVVCFLRRDFTSHTLNMLNTGYNDAFAYVVSDTHMHLTLAENIKLFFCRHKRSYQTTALYQRELRRRLPHLKITSVLFEEPTYANMAMKKAVEKSKRV